MENNLTYTMNGDYMIPDLKIEVPEQPLGKYGRMRQKYLKEHRPILWNQMILEETLFPHLLEIEQAAQSRLEQMMPELAAEAAGLKRGEFVRVTGSIEAVNKGYFVIGKLEELTRITEEEMFPLREKFQK